NGRSPFHFPTAGVSSPKSALRGGGIRTNSAGRSVVPECTIMMDHKTRDALDLDALLELLAAQSASTLGAEAVASLEPLTDLGAITFRQSAVSEVLTLLESNSRVPLGGLSDLTPTLDLAALQGSALSPDHWPPISRH